MRTKYDYLIVGAGVFGCVFAERMTGRGKRCLVIDRRPHIAGNAHCAEVEGIRVHCYGPHIFHTSDMLVWAYINRYAEFNRFINAPIARYKGEIYNLPFNMNTFAKLWNVRTPREARAIIERQTAEYVDIQPQNLEQQALKLVGRDIYEKLIRGYTQKQWGRPCDELPAFIIQRLPLRYTYDNNYFDDRCQGIPIGGYDAMARNMLEGADVSLNTEYADFVQAYPDIAQKTVYTGAIDAFYDYRFGRLEYRTVRLEDEVIAAENWQGNAVVNYTDETVPYTRIIEHKHFEFGKQPVTVISREYPCEWESGGEPYYPIRDEKNLRLYHQYKALGAETPNVLFGGRLATYQYADMDVVVRAALDAAENER